MTRVLLRKELLDVERRAFARVEWGDAFVELGAETPQLLDMRQQLPANLLLIGFGELFDHGEGAFEDFCYVGNIADRAEIG
jgi:hypothetical protein